MKITKKTPKREAKRPKSMAEAIAAYTGRKYLTKAEKKKKLREDTSKKPEASSSDDDAKYESASEFPSESSFSGIRDSSEDLGHSAGESGHSSGEESASQSAAETFDEDVGEMLVDEDRQDEDEDEDDDDDDDDDSSSSSDAESSASKISSEEPVSAHPDAALASITKQSVDAEDSGESLDDEDFIGNESNKESESESESESQNESDEDEDSAGEDSQDDNADEEDDQDQEEQEQKPESTDADTQAGAQNETTSAASANSTNNDDDDDSICQSNQDRLQLKKDLLQDMEKPLSDDSSAGQPGGAHLANGSSVHNKADSVVANHYTLAESEENPFSGRIMRKWSKQYKDTKPMGLLNFGVTCYMNSAIQIMVHIPAIQHYLVEVVQGKHEEIKPRSVTHTFAELALRMWGLGSSKKGTPRKYINPKKMVQRLDDINCMMSEWQQEDSHEYFMSLMSRLQEDSTPKGKKLNQSILYDIFGGLLDQEVICQECNTSSVTKQEFYDLSLGLNKKRTRSNDGLDAPSDELKSNANKYTIEKSLRDFFSTETIRTDKGDASSGYHCEKCKKRTVATKKSAIEKSPQTLMIHLKRFKFNGNSSSKVKQPIHYSKFLDLAPYSQTKTPLKYQLMGVIVHEGRSISSGHYVAHCYQPDGTWSTYDDEYINKIDEATALSDPSAYCLVYMKLEEKTRKRAKTANGNGKRAKTV
ncbi:hypothetical protein JCM33374_g4430 [Metschnikowia sp. JCM 33374]|nr:hypothetical protein JCM33374_g4430 [Metschnikowia sp. JCM 33374]